MSGLTIWYALNCAGVLYVTALGMYMERKSIRNSTGDHK